MAAEPVLPTVASEPVRHVTPEEFQGDLEDFLRVMKSNENFEMTNHDDFNPRLELDSKEGEKPSPEQVVTVSFVSGVEDKWNYKQTLTRREYVRWKLRAKRESGFTMS